MLDVQNVFGNIHWQSVKALRDNVCEKKHPTKMCLPDLNNCAGSLPCFLPVGFRLNGPFTAVVKISDNGIERNFNGIANGVKLLRLAKVDKL